MSITEKIHRMLKIRTFKETPSDSEKLTAAVAVILQMVDSDNGFNAVRDALLNEEEE